ncbi:YceD family protein [Roseovarius salinarum]|uniref:YceD family protein n=1 Tax=Roseovarius salinarum TaxID=1981892 RepID=UPI000C34C441|nr:DUF177 domain-containing protein [Roseovarius salinarum]
MPETGPAAHRLRVADLSPRRPTPVHVAPDSAARDEIARALGLKSLRKLSFDGQVAAQGRADWRLEARLAATVVQDCVATLEPVTTRIEETVIRQYLADPPPLPPGDEIEMPEDDTIEPLGDWIALWDVMVEALALAVPQFPRADGAPDGDASAAPPGADPLPRDENPFAALAGLRDTLKGDEND